MTRLYLIRHGQVAGHDTGRINGQTDVSLTPLGRAQAQTAARRVDAVRLDGIYSSDLSRADYRAACVARGREMSHRPFAALRELHFGDWEGRTHAEVEAMSGAPLDALFARLLQPPTPAGE